ncbi:hypothetical protein DE146DRAFT_29044 [Phaeosphaeria sp. MPI-PUGE-AT-0046c]|nr:hypothetical protein DE146DRAFT_29044 [Phaeosphaeria sp. MPI-PUGE-AT-0046c]
MHLSSDLRFWETKVKAPKSSRSSSKTDVDTRYIAELEATGSFAIKKPKSIRVLKFGRCYIDFGWSPSRARADTRLSTSEGKEYQPHRSSVELSGVELPPVELPAHCDNDSIIELSGDRAQKPPTELPTMSTFEHDTIHELESPVDVDFAQFSTDFEEHQFDLTFPDLDKWEVPSVPRMVHRALPRLTTEAPSPRLHVDNHIEASPYLSSANSSLTPSPVSPVTPNLDATSHTQRQDWPIVSPISARPSSCQSFSHFMQQYAPQYSHHRMACSEPASSFTSTPVEGSLYTTRLTESWNMESGHNSVFPNTPVLPQREIMHYQHSSHELQLPPAPSLNVETSWNDDDFFPTTNDHIDDDSVWFPSFDVESTQPEHNAAENVSTSIGETQRIDTSNHDQIGRVLNDREVARQRSEREVVRNRVSSSSGRATQYPREKCHICDKEFTGRYGRGNLSRHVREKHDLVQPMTGKVCRVCDQVYNRADAKRKHEWKKHRLPDARPNKRRKER